MLPKIFRSNSCIRFPTESSSVYKQKSDKSFHGAENFYKYDENRYMPKKYDEKQYFEKYKHKNTVKSR